MDIQVHVYEFILLFFIIQTARILEADMRDYQDGVEHISWNL